MFLETLTIDQMMDTIANWDNWEGEVVSVSPIPPASVYDDAPEAQNDANLEDQESKFGMAPPADKIGYCPRCGSCNFHAIEIWVGDGRRHPRMMIDTDEICQDCGY